ncbi:chemotaxis protein CheD [Rheinheimera riviphila]|nr:chemotaxis protein CheD [Rheinheimera riviphila]
MVRPVAPPHVIDMFLQPGEWLIADRDCRIRTLLGSCVSFTCWHAGEKIGGMTHFLLPAASAAATELAPGRYADSGLSAMLNDLEKLGLKKNQLQVKIFGGACMFSGKIAQTRQIGQQNIAAARQLIVHHGLNCVAEHVGGFQHRNLIFEVWSGQVWLKQVKNG